MLFLDDLQWADQPTLDLIGAVAATTTKPGLLVIGAYRDHEVGPSHPVQRLRRELEAEGPTVLTLGGLTLDDVSQLLAEVLHVGPIETVRLAGLVHARIAGNPFHTLELLRALHADGALRPDHERRRRRAGGCRSTLRGPVLSRPDAAGAPRTTRTR